MDLTAPQKRLLSETEEQEKDSITHVLKIYDCPDCGELMDPEMGCHNCAEPPARDITARLRRQDPPSRNRT